MLESTPVGNAGDHPPHRQNEQSPILRRAGLYLGVAFELPGTIIGGLLAGYFLDQYLGTSPWLLIVLTAIAFAGAFMRLVRWARFFARERSGSDGKKNNIAH